MLTNESNTMNKPVKRIITLTSILMMTFLANTVQAQDCSRYQILDLRDTVIQGNPYVSFLMTIDTMLLANGGYTSLFFVNAAGDTLNQLTWSERIPDAAMYDTVQQFLPYTNGFTSFPQNFNGFLMMRAPDCDIPFQHGAVGVEENHVAQIVLHPNPSAGWVTISTGEGSTAIDRVEVIDVLGQRSLQVPLNGASSIDCTELLPGHYIVRAWSDTKLLFSKPLIKE